MHDDELERFKRDIPLGEYAIERYGYRRRPRESARAWSQVLGRESDHDKIVVARHPGGHWMYFSVRDGRDSGTIIDFLQHRGTPSLGRVREVLRDWLHTPRPVAPDAADTPPTVLRDTGAVGLAYAAASSPTSSHYLNRRGITPETLSSPLFAGTWKEDARGNVLFPHHDDRGLTGFEIKNAGFTGFSPGGRKALWQSAGQDAASLVILCESAIDALSYQQLHRSRHARYISVSGTLSRGQMKLLDRVFEHLGPEGRIVAAVDADRGGDTLALALAAMAQAHCPDFVRHSPDPAAGKDWNDVLQHVEQDFIRSLAGSPCT